MLLTQTLACETVHAVLSGQNLTEALSTTWRQNPNITPQQRGAVQDIAYGTLRHLGLLEAILNLLASKPLKELELKVLLLTCLYQLQFTRAGAHAIVDHAVNVAAQIGQGKGKGLVNAVLRNFLRQKDELVATAQKNERAKFNHPKWWMTEMKNAYPKQWQQILQANNQHPPMTLRINRRHSDAEHYLAFLAEKGIAARQLGTFSIQLEKAQPVDALPHFFDGWVSVQDWGAQAAAHLLEVQDGQRVLDACAAPGGKSGHILELADVQLTALDADAGRLKRVEDNLARLQQNARIIAADASNPADWWDGKQFDRILADVPCSATGVARRHPDIKWLRRPEDFAEFARQQEKMLDALWPLVASGGKLLYATCSVFPAENHLSAQAFAERHPDARREALSNEHIPADLAEGQLLPNSEHDGFYYALFSKIA
ncbi:16S rRNA (cytosine(967)-C(5))-methyltransferase RsmB [Chitinibacter bivalviorum]|uniref:16S rRNA (cytosine(967)-C(5))-methyltransferase n=1 Tax=Chitinibacter bivalviorum TaxID=2739434 RepID=A0A7H9BK09_9NEIS|nr:16S rRNA (cytosine(967)-C(5))-methyltransferase RsmB [Chitinibacter bivalviorum]QLG88598.1 16S rRNA (cytosine(967)-C(5))-methyltransferase RsmB [Chitinibacter bivalviorum]